VNRSNFLFQRKKETPAQKKKGKKKELKKISPCQIFILAAH
jgi:hypothetical protein